MSFLTMYSELTGAVPKIPVELCKTLVNRAWADVRRKNLWSFQLYEGSWVSPQIINTGNANVTQGINTVTFNAAGSNAISAAYGFGPFPTPITQRQFRTGTSTIYNIWGYNNSNNNVTLTLDRPYTDASNNNIAFQIYQMYYEAPVLDHLTFLSVRDPVNRIDLRLDKNKVWADEKDPQRITYYLPTAVIYNQQQQNPNSNNYGVPVFELFSNGCLYPITYMLYGIRRGADMANDSDTLPYAVGEDCVMAKARYYAYEWAEAHKGEIPRGAGSDFRFLMGAADVEFKRLWKEYRRQDRETVDNWYMVRRQPGWPGDIYGYYNSIAGTATPGAPW